MNIYTYSELFEDGETIDNAFEAIKNLDHKKNRDEQLSKFKFIKKVYQKNISNDQITHVGWLLSPYHYVSCLNNCLNNCHLSSMQLYSAYFLQFCLENNHVILLNQPHYSDTLHNTTFNVHVEDARSHDLIEYRTEHWLHKQGLDGHPLHVSMNCDCGMYDCPFDDFEFSYNEREDFYLHELTDQIPLVKVNIYVSIKDKLKSKSDD
jgi:hypothetical protein